MATNIGTGPQDIPLNQFLGEMAFIDKPPQKPGFYARRSISGDGRAANSQEWTIAGTGSYNRGGHFDISNGRFTAPVDGVYFFSAAPGYKQTGLEFSIKFQVNGVVVSEPVRFIDGGDDLVSHSLACGTIAINLTAGQYVDVVIPYTHHVNVTTNFFCGYLLG